MNYRIHTMFAITTIVGLFASDNLQAGVIGKTTEGKPDIRSINVISFAPEGVLLIGDGAGAQMFAVKTGDNQPQKPLQGKIQDFRSKLAARVGAASDGIEIIDLAVNPASGTVFIAVRRQDDRQYVILTIDGSGEISEFALDNVSFARLELKTKSAATVNRVTDIAWAEDRVVAAARSNESFASKIFSISAPLVHDAAGTSFSAETYHVSHRRWETKAPMSVVIPWKEDGKTWVVGAFSCTPIVKYPIDALKPGATVKGESMIELGSGNRPIDMFIYEKEGKPFVLSNTFRFHHEKRPFGPSPYWTVKFEQGLLSGSDRTNENAQRRLGGGSKPITDRIQMVEGFHGVVHMDKLGEAQAVVLRKSEKDFDLEVLPLP